MKATWWIYVSQSLEKHSFGPHFFIPDLKASRDFIFFSWAGTITGAFTIISITPKQPYESAP